MISEILFFWTPVSIITAALSGIALAIVRARLLPAHPIGLFGVMLAVAGTFYYLPLMVQRAADPSLVVNGLRTVGTWILFLFFCLSTTATLWILKKMRGVQP